MADEELPNEEKLQIAQHFLLSSPPGQFVDVLSDVRRILPAGILPDSLAAGMARAYNNKTSKVVTAPSGKKVVISAAGEIDPSHYWDSKSGQSFAIDHLSLVTRDDGTEPNRPSTVNELTRAAVQHALDAYVSRKFLCEESAGSVFELGDGSLQVIIAGERPNLRNFWSGKWTSTWVVALNGGGHSADVQGDIKIHGHYFEDGNVQLQTAKAIPSTKVVYSSEAELGEKLVSFIQGCENEIQVGLEAMYANMNEETFKLMRRILPVKRTKMDWNINAVRMNRQVRK